MKTCTDSGRKWDAADLVRRLTHALDIAEKVINRFAVNGYTDSSRPDFSLRPEKIISETALLLFVASTVAKDLSIRYRVASLCRLLVPHARSQRTLLGVCMQPSHALTYAQAHVFLTKLGFPDEEFDVLLQQSICSQACMGRERPPHRMLEQTWIADIWNDNLYPAGGLSTIVMESALNRPIDLLSGTREDIYALTHALMYVTRFNMDPLPLPRPKREILAEVEVALARCLDEDDYDLAGELLLAWPLMREPWSAAATFSFQVLARVEDIAGWLPSFTTRLARADELQGDDRVNYLLATAYHTVYVMGLLCAAAMQPDSAPPRTLGMRHSMGGVASSILRHLNADDRQPHWIEDLNGLPDEGRGAIAGFLFNVALHRSVAKRDFENLHKLLELGYMSDLADTPAASQVAEMLERVVTLGRISEVKASSG